MKQYYIYMTTNLQNGKKYIGKHFGELDDSYLGSGKLLRQAIKKYGKENFVKEILDLASSEEENCLKEKYYIALFDATQNEMFYNIAEGGEGGNLKAGYTLEEKLAFSKRHSEYAYNVRDNSVYRTDVFRKKMSQITSGENNGMYGKRHSKESKEKMSQHSKGLTAGEKNGMYGKSGENAINGKQIAMYDENWNLEQVFNTKQLALDFLNLKGHVSLNKAIKNGSLYRGHYWKQLDKGVETN